jgi:hypothetical protein
MKRKRRAFAAASGTGSRSRATRRKAEALDAAHARLERRHRGRALVEPPETSARSPKAWPGPPDAEHRGLPERRDDRVREAPFDDQVECVRRIAAVEDDLERVCGAVGVVVARWTVSSPMPTAKPQLLPPQGPIASGRRAFDVDMREDARRVVG